MTTAEINELRLLARECPFTYGKPVYRARVLLAAVDSFNTEYINECEVWAFADNKSMHQADDPQSDQHQEFFVYPNPAREIINITWTNVGFAKSYNFNLTDILGHRVYSRTFSTNENSVSFDVSELSKGMYFYFIENENSVLSSGKLVITR